MSLEQKYISHIIQSIETQVGFLQESGRLSAQDAELINSKVRQAQGTDHLVSSLSQIQLEQQPSQPGTAAAAAASAPNAPAAQQPQQSRVVPPVPTKPGSLRSEPPSEPPKQLARALWDYNSQTPGDLSFSKGQTIEILREENEHWFFGQCGPQQGLFPSNYVERLPEGASQQQQTRAVPPPPPMPQYSQGYAPAPPGYQQPAMYGTPEKTQPSPAAYYQPPPPQQHYAPPPPGQIMVSTPPEQKKNRFHGLGNTMAHGAAGGVGFGLASSAVQSIF